MGCLQCGCRHFSAVSSRESGISFRGKQYAVTRKKMICRHCGMVKMTVEKELVADPPRNDIETRSAVSDDHQQANPMDGPT